MRAKAVAAGLFVGAVALSPVPAGALLCGTVLEPVRVTTTGLNFGNYSPGAGDSAINATIKLDCGLLSADILPNFTIALSSGHAATPTSRYMLGGTVHLNYNLYTTSAHSAVWGDSTGGVRQTFNTPNLGTITYTVYGVVFGSQFVTPGLYSDLLTVTVTY